MRPDGLTKLIDFGVAALVDEVLRSGLPLDGVPGTPAYLAPELAQDQLPTPATDIWSLGVTLFELIAGQRPFGAPSTFTRVPDSDDTTVETTHPASSESHVPLSALRIVPPMLDSLVEACLSSHPERRPSASELEAALWEIASRHPSLCLARRQRRWFSLQRHTGS
jgi:serine/threonine protein kinase